MIADQASWLKDTANRRTATTIEVTSLGSPDASGNYVVPSRPYTQTAAGCYQWVVTYGGDANNGEVSSACTAPDEASVVTQATATGTAGAERDGSWLDRRVRKACESDETHGTDVGGPLVKV
jgi:hypothetical protein